MTKKNICTHLGETQLFPKYFLPGVIWSSVCGSGDDEGLIMSRVTGKGHEWDSPGSRDWHLGSSWRHDTQHNKQVFWEKNKLTGTPRAFSEFGSHKCSLIQVFVYHPLPWLHVLYICRWLKYSELLTWMTNCQHRISTRLALRHLKLSQHEDSEPLIFSPQPLTPSVCSVSRNSSVIHTGTHSRNLRFISWQLSSPLLISH